MPLAALVAYLRGETVSMNISGVAPKVAKALFTDFTTHTLAGVTAMGIVGTIALPAGVLGTLGSMRISLTGTKSGAAGKAVIEVYYGATKLFEQTNLNNGASTITMDAVVCNTSAAAQRTRQVVHTAQSGSTVQIYPDVATSAANTAVGADLTYKMSLSNAGDGWTSDYFVCHIEP